MRSPFFRAAAIVALGVLTVFPSCPAFGDDASRAHVAVVEFSNETGSSSYDAACRSATETLILTLRQLGRYSVQSENSPVGGEEALRAMAADGRLDFIMQGKLSKPATGGIACSLSVFDRAKGKTAISRSEKATGVLDIFDATDALVVSVLEAMTGSHIGFGTITLKNTGEKGSYAVLLDGSPAGNDLASIEKALIGRRTVAIVQKRMLGDREIARSSLDVKEGESVDLDFALPLLMDDEKAKLEGLKAAIKSGWNDEAMAGDVDAKTSELSSLLKDISFSPKLSAYRDEAKQLAGEWALQKARFAIEGSAWDPKLEFLDAGSAVSSGAKGYPDALRIRKAFEEDARLLETLFDLKAGKDLGDGDLNAGLGCFGNALMVSTRYLSGNRMTDYAYAMTTLKSLQDLAETEGASVKDDRGLNAVFGDLIRAGQRFFGLKDKVASGAAVVLVGSDFAKALSVDGGDYAEAPFAVKLASGQRSLSVQPKGDAKPLVLTAAAKSGFLFVDDGFAPFGKIALGAAQSAAPGAVEVEMAYRDSFYSNEDSIECSLDGGIEVPVPHVFENVPPGNHTIRIPEFRGGDKLYDGLEETVMVEPGKRLTYDAQPKVGKGELHIEQIPTGSRVLIDGVDQGVVENPSGVAVFVGQLDAGFSQIEVLRGDRKWIMTALVPRNGMNRYSVKDMACELQRKTIKLKGKLEDWEGVENIFGPAVNSAPTKISGSVIAGGTICWDDKNVYVRIDFSNGKPDDFGPECWRYLGLTQGGNYISLNFNIWGSTGHSNIWEKKWTRTIECGSYAIGPSFVELKIPISLIPKYLDLSKSFDVLVGFGDKTGYWNGSPQQRLIFGK
jgi:hypothetical protein